MLFTEKLKFLKSINGYVKLSISIYQKRTWKKKFLRPTWGDYKEHLQINKKIKNNPIKNGQETSMEEEIKIDNKYVWFSTS